MAQQSAPGIPSVTQMPGTGAPLAVSVTLPYTPIDAPGGGAGGAFPSVGLGLGVGDGVGVGDGDGDGVGGGVACCVGALVGAAVVGAAVVVVVCVAVAAAVGDGDVLGDDDALGDGVGEPLAAAPPVAVGDSALAVGVPLFSSPPAPPTILSDGRPTVPGGAGGTQPTRRTNAAATTTRVFTVARPKLALTPTSVPTMR